MNTLCAIACLIGTLGFASFLCNHHKSNGQRGKANNSPAMVCATNEGRAGVCKSKCKNLMSNEKPYECPDSDGNEQLICCPPTKGPGMYPPQLKNCGKRPDISATDRNLTRIVGGQASANHSWPWQLALFMDDSFSCGASIISNYYALTASHCVINPSDGAPIAAENFKLLVGSTRVEPPDGQFVGVEKVMIHENARFPLRYNDITLLRVKEPFTWSPTVSPVCLPSPQSAGQSFGGSRMTATGFGIVTPNGPNAESLREVEVPVIANSDCKYDFILVGGSYEQIPDGIIQSQLCAGEDGKDACQGDSGGPLHYFDKNQNAWIQEGISSFGSSCAEDGYPGIYTRVDSFLKWIGSHMN